MAGHEKTDLNNALIPFPPLQRRGSCDAGYIDEASRPTAEILEELGFDGPRVALRDDVYEQFARIAGGHEMTEERFIAIAAQQFSLPRVVSRACFHASDIRRTGRMNKEGYLLFREAFVHDTSGRPQHDAVMALRLRTVFHKYVASRPAQRDFWDLHLTRSEALSWIRDLCAGETHVGRVAELLLPRLVGDRRSPSRKDPSRAAVDGGACEAEISIDEFVDALMQGDLQDLLETQALSLDDLGDSIRAAPGGPGQPMHCYSRAVIDGRAERATLRWSDAYGVGLPARSRSVVSSAVPRAAVNDDMQLDPHVRAVGGWRGPLAPGRDAQEFDIAMSVVDSAHRLARQEIFNEDIIDSAWKLEGEVLEELLGPGEAQQAQKFVALAKACRTTLESHPPLVRVPAPSKVFGDVHGQFRDLLMLFAQFGFPSHCGGDVQTTTYVFNGDFVDRGEHQLEVVLMLFALKVMYPSHVFLLRGNHEFRDMSELPNDDAFRRHLMRRLPTQWMHVYNAVHGAFDWLPLAALIGGKVLVLHGGLGDGKWGLQDIERVERPLRALTDGFLLDILWSDPSDSDATMYRGVHENPDRGDTKIHLFGPDVTAAFCKREGVNIIIRSHQYVPTGYKVMHGGHMITLFSARNYFADDENDGALLLLAPDRNGHLRIHPKTLLATPLPPVMYDSDEDWLNNPGGWVGLAAKLRKSMKGLSGKFAKYRAGCGECLEFLQHGGQRKKPDRKSSSHRNF